MDHSNPVLALFDFGISHYFISDNFTALHPTLVCMDIQWEISIENGVVTTNIISED